MRFLAFFIIILSTSVYAQNYSNSHWGDTPEQVKKNEKNFHFLREEALDRNLKGLTFIEDRPDGTYFLHTFMFLNMKLYGVKTKKVYLDGDNSLFKGLNDYNQKLQAYKENFKDLVEEKVQDINYDLKGFHIKTNQTTLYVSLKKEEDNYFIIETTFQNLN
ncbi:MAG: hypothetical protein ACK4ND_05065 [Cytophagaceae bacterium]